ncbi:guanine nucleotide-exchange factor SEC12 isoform X2 [Mycteria americana]|uniref:guanine nucleotide-exchange factor SEC12 isoform X2 n=1 Tax=Mycteria americana TaxID=33587 RepID=UPI003F58A672
MAPRRPAELYRAPFPLYTVRLHPRRPLAITAGGGGAAKTGIRNGVHFLQLEQIGGRLSASLLHSHDTETRATMTMALADDIIAAGQDASCHILRFSLRAPEARSGSAGRNGSGEKGLRKRKGPGPVAQGDTQSRTSEVTVESLHSVRTDFSPDALQKAVRFNADCSLLVTGGADGFLRLWEFPSMKKTLEFKAHDGEIEDIALGPDNKVVTAGRDFQCCVWQHDQLVTGLRWNENLPGIPDKAYRYQACRDSGTFLGLGTVTGSVAIHVAFSLQRLYYVKEAHGIVVTDVAFVPESRRGRELLAGNEAALLSVAVDSRCKLHLLPSRRSLPVWLLLLLCAGLIVATILLLQLAFPGFL